VTVFASELAGISSRRAKVFATQVERHEGAVYSRPVVPAMFRKRAATAASLPGDVTHIVVDNATSRAGIQELLGVSELPESVKVRTCLSLINNLLACGFWLRSLRGANGGVADCERGLVGAVAGDGGAGGRARVPR
jgi:hypothetical protein